MGPTDRAVKLIHAEEGCVLRAYWDKKGVCWTIGWGNTRYEDGSRVKEGDVITQERADKLALNILNSFAVGIDDMTTDAISQVQFDALCSLVYNIGLTNYKTSTVRMLINYDPNDPLIAEAWKRWKFAAHDHTKPDPVLVRRREREVSVYFSENRYA